MSRDARVTLSLLAVVVILSIVVAIRETRSSALTPLLSSSAEPTGAKALTLWLDALGYDVSTRTLSKFELSDDISTLLILYPTTPTGGGDIDVINEWIDAGGTLVLAADTFSQDDFVSNFGFDMLPLYAPVGDVTPTGPLLRNVVGWDSAEVEPDFYLASENSDFVTLLAFDDKPVAVTFEQGDGRVVITTLDDAFSNAGLKREGNGALVLNLIGVTNSAETGTIWFDDWHHGVRSFVNLEIIGPNAWLRRTFPGRAILFAGLLGVVMLVWQSRRFGRPMTLPNTRTARAPLEYITAIANLNRRANTQSAVQADYAQRLKRKFGARYRIDPALPDGDFLQALRIANPKLDHNAIGTLITQLNRANLDESVLLEQVRIATDILDN